MKTRIFFFLVFIFLGIGCIKTDRTFVIEGTVPSVRYDGEWIFLVPMENAPGRVDSVKISNASFKFEGQGEEMRVIRLRPALRYYVQELLVITEPGVIKVTADSIGCVSGTPQNDALQIWKAQHEKRLAAYHFIYDGLKEAKGDDSLRLIQAFDTLKVQEKEANFLLLMNHKNTTLGKFMQRIILPSLTNEQKKQLDEKME